MADNKRVTFSSRNSFACDHEMQSQAFEILNHFYPDPKDERAPSNVREFIQDLMDKLQELGMSDLAQKYRKAIDDNHDLQKEVNQLIQDKDDLQTQLDELSKSKKGVEDELSNHRNNPKVIVLDDESYSELQPFFEKFKQADPEATPAQALACLPDALRSTQKATGSKGFRLENGKLFSFR